jgi:hypothetical protein
MQNRSFNLAAGGGAAAAAAALPLPRLCCCQAAAAAAALPPSCYRSRQAAHRCQAAAMLPIFLTFGNLISGFISLVSNSLISLSYQQ